MRLENRVAVVTGGASGLGEGTARAIAATGAKVALFDMNAEKGEAIANAVNRVAVILLVMRPLSRPGEVGVTRVRKTAPGNCPGGRFDDRTLNYFMVTFSLKLPLPSLSQLMVPFWNSPIQPPPATL